MRLFHLASGFFMIASLCLGAFAGYLWLNTPPVVIQPAVLEVQNANFDIGEVPTDTYVELELLVRNTSDRPLRILGFAGG